MKKLHTFHIPVMGIGFTIDTPLKVSHLGIDSVISLVDDILIEKLRKMYSRVFGESYEEISETDEDHRARRITSYLNLIHRQTECGIEKLKAFNEECMEEMRTVMDLLPDTSGLKNQWHALVKGSLSPDRFREYFNQTFQRGSIDVNIMTKVDKDNYKNGEKLDVIYNDAHAALRGFAESDLNASLVLSAGMNPRLFTYMESFAAFFPDADGNLQKRIILKVSDYRSALVQGKILAKKGLWVSEFRIESGLNCGGHAFATDGLLMGPILEQFKRERENLVAELHELYSRALLDKGFDVPKKPFLVSITAQGGVGTAGEHEFLLKQYGVDSVGWGTPFLLVPEATTVDEATLQKLLKAKEEDLYLSDISPLGVPFHNLKGNTKDEEKEVFIRKNRPGSSCPKKYVSLNTEYKQEGLCTASRQYQYLKLKELEGMDPESEEYRKEYEKITVKSCTCVGLGTTALIKYNLDRRSEGEGVSVCPGPNMAYFSKKMSLREITGHIYGTGESMEAEGRPHMFIKELGIYLDYLGRKLKDTVQIENRKQQKYFEVFVKNLEEGIGYYRELFREEMEDFERKREELSEQLDRYAANLNGLILRISEKSVV